MNVFNQHPYIQENDEKVLYDTYKTDTGYFGCGQDEVDHEIDDLGIGISIYFKIIKLFGIVFALISLMNIILITIFCLNNTSRPTTNHMDVLFKTTIGNLVTSKYY